MLSPLESQPLNLVMEMLENIAKRHDLLLSIDLINFADDIYKIAYERGAEDEREACAKLLETTDLGGLKDNPAMQSWVAEMLLVYVKAIRARGQA